MREGVDSRESLAVMSEFGIGDGAMMLSQPYR